MAKASAGILCWRGTGPSFEVLLVHPGGPWFAGKDDGVWTLPKGELDDGETPIDAALREFAEETSFPLPNRASLVALGTVKQRSGKVVHGFAVAHDVDPTTLVSGTFELEWPPRSGRRGTFPEVDRAEWCTPQVAARRLNPAQVAFVDRLRERLGTT